MTAITITRDSGHSAAMRRLRQTQLDGKGLAIRVHIGAQEKDLPFENGGLVEQKWSLGICSNDLFHIRWLPEGERLLTSGDMLVVPLRGVRNVQKLAVEFIERALQRALEKKQEVLSNCGRLE